MTGAYGDIIHLPHYQSKKRSHMSMHDRAAQFAPFAALTGFEAAIEETGRLTDCRTELEEYGTEQLNQALLQLKSILPLQPQVTLTYFLPDERKSGGHYASVQGQVRKIDFYHQVIILMDGTEISMPDILQIECDHPCE